MIRAAALSVLLTPPALAQPVRVTTGEHEGFTRLALQLPTAEAWQLARVDEGYELTLATPATFDLSQVYRPIGKDRLATIWADPRTGRLRLGIGCACYAIPFEYRPGIIVIDIRDGAAPAGSAFEEDADGQPMLPLAARPALRPRPRPAPVDTREYDWLAARAEEPRTGFALRPGAPPGAADSQPPKLPVTDGPSKADLLRDALLQQLSRGASEGIVDLQLPAGSRAARGEGDLPMTQIRIEASPGRIGAEPRAPLTAAGDDCPAPDRLALQDWMSDGPVAWQFGPAMDGLTGEFDRPNPEAVAHAAHFLLALGFGAETRSLLSAFPIETPDAALWRSLSFIVDDEHDPAPAFRGMAACDDPAALWALLTSPPPRDEPVATGAALQAFSALPAHLRQGLGPRLASVLLDLGKTEAAEAVVAAVARASPPPNAETALLAANIALATGKSELAEARSAAVADEPGPSMAEGLATLIEARVAQGLPVGPEQVTAVEALLRERRGDASALRLSRALVLARAASGDFDGAFAALSDAPDIAPRLWSVLARSGSDDELLRQAVARGPSPDATQVAPRIAARLVDMGLGKAAQAWIAAMAEPDALLSARAALAEVDGRGALRALAGSSGPEAEGLRAAALTLIGDDAAAAESYDREGRAEDRALAEIRARDWDAIARDGPAPWRGAAGLIAAEPPSAPSEGLLTQSRGLADQSAVERSMLEDLLHKTASVSAPAVTK
ncbi:MAG: hypothetical protein QM656_02800 [Paracoccaceae bacterium]